MESGLVPADDLARALANEKLISWVGSWLIRAVSYTLRMRIADDAGYFTNAHQGEYIFTFWHNRMFALCLPFERFYGKRKGASVLTSPSRDGDLLAAFMGQFGMGAIRGSSSRRGAAAVRELNDLLAAGCDVIITPDGPRGPPYRLGPGIIFLARKSGRPIMPIRVEYARCVRLKSWDRFMIPLPFSRVEITLEKLFWVKPAGSDEESEAQRAELEKLMQPHQE